MIYAKLKYYLRKQDRVLTVEIGIPKETDFGETRISLAPISVRTLVERGSEVFVEKGAGLKAGFPDDLYEDAGAKILPSAEKLYANSTLIVKVKELAAVDLELLNDKHIILAFYYLFTKPDITQKLMGTKATCLAYENVVENGDAYVLRAMSEICGKMAMQKASEAQQFKNKGRGMLLSGLPGIDPPTVLVIGAGSAGYSAAEMAVSNGNRVFLFDRDHKRLETVYRLLGPHITTLPASSYHFTRILPKADVVIGAVQKPYSLSPIVITKEMLKLLKPGSVIVDLSIDQGGCIETIRETTHESPFYNVNDLVFSAIPNLPAAVPHTSSLALNGAIYSIVLRLAKYGLDYCVKHFEDIRNGMQLLHGRVVAKDLASTMQEKLFNLDALTLD